MDQRMRRLNKTDFFNAMPTIFSIVAMLAMSWISVTNTTRDWLNSDVIIHSMISLLNVTEFYWGQERLLNILPALFSWVSDPSANLFLILLTSAFSQFFLFFIFAALSVVVYGGKINSWKTTFVFLLTSATFFFTIADYAIFEIAVYHYEWPLAIVLAVAGLYFFKKTSNIFVAIALGLIFAGLSVGLNFSVSAIIAATVLFLFLTKLWTLKDFLWWILIGLIVMTFWIIRSGDLRSRNFKNFLWENYGNYIATSIDKIYSSINPLKTAIFMTLILGLIFLVFIFKSQTVVTLLSDKSLLPLQIVVYGSLFSVLWLLVFAQNDWVVINSNHFRYFLPLIYFSLLVFSLLFAVVAHTLNAGSKSVVGLGVLGIVLVAVFGWYPKPIAFHEANVVTNAQLLAPEDGKYVAGDFWIAWPYSLGQLLESNESVSLALRSEQNTFLTRPELTRDLEQNGYVDVICLGEDTNLCKQQIEFHLGLDSPPQFTEGSKPYILRVTQ